MSPPQPSSAVDYAVLLNILSRPRPNGSAAESETAQALQTWLKQRGIPFRCQFFRCYPYQNEAVGMWLIASRTLLVLAVFLHWGWVSAVIALVGLLGGLLDIGFGIPLISWPGARYSPNILVEFEPAHTEQELILAAHYDSKTELLDHARRAIFTRNLRLGIWLTVAMGCLGIAYPWLTSVLSAPVTTAIAVIVALPVLFLAWGLGLHLALGRLVAPSQGAIDNGASCAILLGLAQDLHQKKVLLDHTRVTIALFTGEEVNMQGSRAYLASRLRPSPPAWPLAVVNLELMAQDGAYVLWQRDGSVFRQIPTDARLNAEIATVLIQETGASPQSATLINSDAYSFLSAGWPASVLGTFDTRLADGGLHRPADNLDRVKTARLPEGVHLLSCLVRQHDLPPHLPPAIGDFDNN
ncbi:MAG: M28 family peptidase [Chloroflexi bacterium]|nr:M28 family peptidase [Chloroflexota bacterium]